MIQKKSHQLHPLSPIHRLLESETMQQLCTNNHDYIFNDNFSRKHTDLLFNHALELLKALMHHQKPLDNKGKEKYAIKLTSYRFTLPPANHFLQQSITHLSSPKDYDSGQQVETSKAKTDRVNSTSPQDSSKPCAAKCGPNSNSVPPPVTSTASHMTA